MSKHTEGPWSFQPLAGDHDFAVYQEQSGEDVALVRNFDESNAQLIAAAPEMLAALKQADDMLADICAMFPEKFENDAGFHNARKHACDAIAKAEGA